MSEITVDRQKVVEAAKVKLRPMVYLCLVRAIDKLREEVVKGTIGPDVEDGNKSVEAAVASHCVAAELNSHARRIEVTSELAGTLRTCSQLLEEADKTVTRLAEEAVNKVLPE